MSTRSPQEILDAADRKRNAYEQVAVTVNNDPRRTLQARRDDLASAWQTAEEEIKGLRSEYAEAVEAKRTAVRRNLVPYGVEGSEVRRALAELANVTPDAFQEAARLADVTQDKAMRAALRIKATEDARLAALLPEAEQQSVARALEFEQTWGNAMPAQRKMEVNGFGLGMPIRVEAKQPEAPKQTGGYATDTGEAFRIR